MTATSETGKTDNFPNQFEVITSEFNLTVTDGSGSPSLSKNFTSNGDLVIVYNRQSCIEENNKTTCTYTTNFSEPLLNLELDGTTLRTFYNQIWTSGESPNPVTGNFSIIFRGDKFPPSDTEVTYTLVSSGGTLEF